MDSRTTIKHRMWELDLTQEQLSERTGLTQPAISRIINGHVRRTEKAAFKLARALELPVDALTPDDEAVPA